MEMGKESYAGSFDFLKIFYPIFVIFNAIRLRVSFFEKQRCLTSILKKEIKNLFFIEIYFYEKLGGGASVQALRLYFEIEGKATFIKVNRDIFEKYSEGDKIPIEYLIGFDRIHARLIK